jgi:hypothetical protein
MLHYKNILFVHIPKTAGASIRHFLVQNNLDNWNRNHIFTHHDPIFLLEQNNHLSETFKFSVVRNPYTRAFSHYKHIQTVKNIHISFNEFLNYVRINGNIRLVNYSSNDQIKFNEQLPLITYTQSFYLHGLNGEIGVDRVYKFEHINEFESDFNTTLSVLNKGSYDVNEYLSNYDKTNQNLVRLLYHNDFVNFNYSLHFDDSI